MKLIYLCLLISEVIIPFFSNISRNDLIKDLVIGAFSHKPICLFSKVFLSKQRAALDNKYNFISSLFCVTGNDSG